MKKLMYICLFLGFTSLQAQTDHINFFKGNNFYIDSFTVIDNSVITTIEYSSTVYSFDLLFQNSKEETGCSSFDSSDAQNRLFIEMQYCYSSRLVYEDMGTYFNIL